MLSAIFSNPALFLLWFSAVAVTLSVHEFSHAAVAVLLGDDTPRRMGRLTLNPLAHADILGTIMMLFVGFGWAKPVPFNPHNLRFKKWGPSLVAFAGPCANLLMVIIAGVANLLLLPFLGPDNLLAVFLMFLATASVGLFLFNLIPIPPLDGSKFLLDAFSAQKYAKFRYLLETRGPFLLLALILIENFSGFSILSGLFGPVMSFALSIFHFAY